MTIPKDTLREAIEYIQPRRKRFKELQRNLAKRLEDNTDDQDALILLSALVPTGPHRIFS